MHFNYFQHDWKSIASQRRTQAFILFRQYNNAKKRNKRTKKRTKRGKTMYITIKERATEYTTTRRVDENIYNFIKFKVWGNLENGEKLLITFDGGSITCFDVYRGTDGSKHYGKFKLNWEDKSYKTELMRKSKVANTKNMDERCAMNKYMQGYSYLIKHDENKKIYYVRDKKQ